MTIEENKILCKKMPYLIVRDWRTGKIPEDYDYTYTWLNCNELPDGWINLFWEMCQEIYEPLERAGLLNDFYFVQVKEKFNTMRCYSEGANDEVQKILYKYEDKASRVCTICGKAATRLTRGYIAAFCDECAAKLSCNTVSIDEDPFGPSV